MKRTRFPIRAVLGALLASVASFFLAGAGVPSPAQAQTLPLTGIQGVAAGFVHTCALTTSGALKCWGNNEYGQLGDGSTSSRLGPVGVAGLTSGVSSFAPGVYHSCAVNGAGGAVCWGGNDNGQLGDGSTTLRTSAVGVIGLTSGVSALAAGLDHSCALTATGALKCWGGNAEGQLGNNSNSQSLTAVDVQGLASGVLGIAAGRQFTCALVGDAVKCWGRNSEGQLGIGGTTASATPVTVAGLGSGVSAIAAGFDHACALTSAGSVKCWGENSYGQLGDNSLADRSVPVDVLGLSNVAAIAAGAGHTCARTTAGAVKCWGANLFGQIGDETTALRLTPVDVSGFGAGASSITAGAGHTCVLTTQGGVRCWGMNGGGQLGDGIPANRLKPMDVFGLTSGLTRIALGAYHSCALTSAGGVKCWGDNDYGQLGDGTTTDRLLAVDVLGLTSGVSAVVAGVYHTCALTNAGGVKCWGGNWSGQLGDDSNVPRATPVDVSGLTAGAGALAAGGYHTCARTLANGLKCWGENSMGQVGDSSTLDRKIPVDVTGLLGGVIDLTAGLEHSCALLSGGGVKCWGYNLYGQLGDGSTTTRNAPVSVPAFPSGVAALAAGGTHTCARTTGGAIKCWGGNGYGQLGNGSTASSATPVDVAGFSSGTTYLVAGFLHNCALTTDGIAKCWGFNTNGELGNRGVTASSTPVEVFGQSGGATGLAAGRHHSCLLTTSGSAKCWGYNAYGQLGDGTAGRRAYPDDVLLLRRNGASWLLLLLD